MASLACIIKKKFSTSSNTVSWFIATLIAFCLSAAANVTVVGDAKKKSDEFAVFSDEMMFTEISMSIQHCFIMLISRLLISEAV